MNTDIINTCIRLGVYMPHYQHLMQAATDINNVNYKIVCESASREKGYTLAVVIPIVLVSELIVMEFSVASF